MSSCLASEIAVRVGGQLFGEDIRVDGVCSIKKPLRGKIGFVNSSLSGTEELLGLSCVFLVHQRPEFQSISSFIVVPNPRLSFAYVSEVFDETPDNLGIHATAIVHSTARVHQSLTIGPYSIVEEGCSIGCGVTIGSHTIVKRRTVIGEGTSIGDNTSIGGHGFGFETDDGGIPIRIRHLGNVIIGSNSEIGSNVVIARGTIDATVIGDDVKIDDHVFIAHNVQVGNRTFVIAGAEVSGSVEIGEDCWVSPQVTIINGVSIGSGSLLGIGSVVLRDVPHNSVAVGNPARVIKPRA